MSDAPARDPVTVADSGADSDSDFLDEFEVRCRVVPYEDGDECTLYPSDADEEELVTKWVSAKGDSFVDLEERR
ncbi:DUF7511 domain-containing protein [Halospeciosus flavus]|uniref:DUF7511 domain-containing protein n=1 Tax=Halospeciosus flavus TaxID=3032283 RepID=A0ABD5Z7X5_9EURY|nr:hypothetical protein [Halospeciosus flavus]